MVLDGLILIIFDSRPVEIGVDVESVVSLKPCLMFNFDVFQHIELFVNIL